MAKLSTNAKTIEKDYGTKVELITALGKHHSIDKSFEIYLSLYQAITGPHLLRPHRGGRVPPGQRRL